jgi:hypothetical protein
MENTQAEKKFRIGLMTDILSYRECEDGKINRLAKTHYPFVVLQFIQNKLTEYESLRDRYSNRADIFESWVHGTEFFRDISEALDMAIHAYLKKETRMATETRKFFTQRKENFKKRMRNFKDEWEKSFETKYADEAYL